MSIEKMKMEVKNVFEKEDTVLGWDLDYYHKVSDQYYNAAVSDLLHSLGATPGATVLDAGCGPGVHSIRAAKAGCRVVAVDFSERMLAHASERARAAGVADQIEFHREDLTQLSFADASFRHVFSWGVVIHIPDARAALENLARITAPGGRLGLQITNLTAADPWLERLARRLVGRPAPKVERTLLGVGTWYDHHGERLWLLRFDAAALEAFMAGLGLRLVDRRAAEYTEIQWRLKGPLRTLLLRFNRLAYRRRFPVRFSCTQIMVFEKS